MRNLIKRYKLLSIARTVETRERLSSLRLLDQFQRNSVTRLYSMISARRILEITFPSSCSSHSRKHYVRSALYIHTHTYICHMYAIHTQAHMYTIDFQFQLPILRYRRALAYPYSPPHSPWIYVGYFPRVINSTQFNITQLAYLEIGWAMVEKLQHVPDVLRVLYHEIQLHVEFTAHELQHKKRGKRVQKVDVRTTV